MDDAGDFCAVVEGGKGICVGLVLIEAGFVTVLIMGVFVSLTAGGF